ncbi:hypothetical protein [Bradyrhizobium sp. RDI18]|uniref:hypothetical protein n=1 Tax=Bradyrhizobium sp. RDI18 TaxID=3367400 RepID=UPI00372495AC
MAAVAVICIAFAMLAIRDHQKLRNTGAPMSAIASSTARYLALDAKAWATRVLITYLMGMDKHWAEWWQFSSTVCRRRHHRLRRPSRSRPLRRTRRRHAGEDGTASSPVSGGGMAAGVISLFVDLKFPRWNPRRLGGMQHLLLWCARHCTGYIGRPALTHVGSRAGHRAVQKGELPTP